MLRDRTSKVFSMRRLINGQLGPYMAMITLSASLDRKGAETIRWIIICRTLGYTERRLEPVDK